MKTGKISILLVPLIIGAGVFVLLWSGLSHTHASASETGSELASTLDRGEDPIIVTGSSLPVFEGKPIDELVLYSYAEGSWSPIPFQIDERTNDVTGTYVIFDDGLLDANDELVFMAKDAGYSAGQMWPDDLEARQNPRQMIIASDPLDAGANGWAYLYRSTTLATNPDNYVDWDETLQSVTAVSYTASFNPSSFVGLADLTVNGNGIDILDRQKIRLQAFIFNFNEEDLINFITPTISIPVIGSVRGVANGGQFNVSIYGARLDFSVSLDATGLPLSIDEIRTSFDLNNPALTGISHFYNSNGSDETIDGVPDAVASSPPIDWYQVSGAPGGLVVVIPEADPGGGTVTNYYKDDSNFDPNDTGDGMSYGDTGLVISDPGDLVQFSLSIYALPLDSLANVGLDYFDRSINPLSTTTSVQFFGAGKIFVPVIINPA